MSGINFPAGMGVENGVSVAPRYIPNEFFDSKRSLGFEKFTKTTPFARKKILSMMLLSNQLGEESRQAQRRINRLRELLEQLKRVERRGEDELQRLAQNGRADNSEQVRECADSLRDIHCQRDEVEAEIASELSRQEALSSQIENLRPFLTAVLKAAETDAPYLKDRFEEITTQDEDQSWADKVQTGPGREFLQGAP